MINGIIYKATNTINGKVYIGQTVKTLEIRIIGHLSSSRSGKYPSNYFFRAMNKYGEDAFQWEEIDQADTNAELDEKEVYWIKFYNANGEGGYNLTDGGSGVRGYKVTEEGVERRRNVLKEMWANGHASTLGIGEDAPNAKFTNKEVRKIGELIMEGVDNDIISVSCNIEKSNLHAIKMGNTWSHLFTDEEQLLMKTTNLNGAQWFTEKEILEVRDLLLHSPLHNKQIAEIYGLCESSMYTTPNSKKWGHLFSEEDKKKISTKNKKNTITKEDAIQVKRLLKENQFNPTEIAWIVNIPAKTVGTIKRGTRWAHVKLEDEIPENENP
jgi:group I intron endonuclease